MTTVLWLSRPPSLECSLFLLCSLVLTGRSLHLCLLECLVDPRSQHSRFSPPLVSSLASCQCPGKEGLLRFVLRMFRDRRGHFAVHGGTQLLELASSRWQGNFFVGDLRLECFVSPGGIESRASPRRYSCVSLFRCEQTGMLSGADAFADELDEEGVDGSDIGTVNEWLSFCDNGFPSFVRVEDLGCIGIREGSRSLSLLQLVPAGPSLL